MAIWHGYIAAEDLGMSAANRQTVLQVLNTMGISNDDPQPCLRTHWRVRLDNLAVIYEAAYDDSTLSVSYFKNLLATATGLPVGNITSSNNQISYGLVITFAYNSLNRFRLAMFGYAGSFPDWETSRQNAVAYLIANAATWGES